VEAEKLLENMPDLQQAFPGLLLRFNLLMSRRGKPLFSYLLGEHLDCMGSYCPICLLFNMTFCSGSYIW
jgi:hypothetical protein